MDLDLIIEELRKLEGINTSFDYGVELLIMCIKQYSKNIREDNIKAIIEVTDFKWSNLFNYDKVCKQGFEVASDKLVKLVNE